MKDEVLIIGGGLAGSEAAWQLAKRGVRVKLIEMKPRSYTPAHRLPYLAELVCSNSFGSRKDTAAISLLQDELSMLGSLIIESAKASSVPAGKALAVDRERFSIYITRKLQTHPLIEIVVEEMEDVPDGIVIIATGPLTTEKFKNSLKRFISADYLHFFDAVSPLVEASSINWSKVFWASRYSDDGDYVNCPFTEEEYIRFWKALKDAEVAYRHSFDEKVYFEACLPVEVMAKRGKDTLRYGPMKPVGIVNPVTGKMPYAVVQLRRDDAAETLFNMVGFQTGLKWSEQKRVFRMIPGLENAVFERYGVVHLNFFVNAPVVLEKSLQLKSSGRIFLAGQITGVEGYLPSTAMGFVAGVNAYALVKGMSPYIFPDVTIIGSLLRYITTPTKRFQPMNANWGILPPLDKKVRDRQMRRLLLRERALSALYRFAEDSGLLGL